PVLTADRHLTALIERQQSARHDHLGVPINRDANVLAQQRAHVIGVVAQFVAAFRASVHAGHQSSAPLSSNSRVHPRSAAIVKMISRNSWPVIPGAAVACAWAPHPLQTNVPTPASTGSFIGSSVTGHHLLNCR